MSNSPVYLSSLIRLTRDIDGTVRLGGKVWDVGYCLDCHVSHVTLDGVCYDCRTKGEK